MDDTLLRSTLAIDSVMDEKARRLTAAIETHVRQLADSLGRQAKT
jgi:hypothetical protein